MIGAAAFALDESPVGSFTIEDQGNHWPDVQCSEIRIIAVFVSFECLKCLFYKRSVSKKESQHSNNQKSEFFYQNFTE